MKTPPRILDFESYLLTRLKEEDDRDAQQAPFASHEADARRPLDLRRIAHRRRMLEHLRRTAE
jgi:hypothetical protein